MISETLKRTLLLLPLLFAPAIALAQTVEPMPVDSEILSDGEGIYDPAHDHYTFSNYEAFTIRHLVLDLDIDFQNKALVGTALLHVRVLDTEADTLILDTRDIVIEAAGIGVTADGLSATTFRLGKPHELLGQALEIDLPPGIMSGEEFVLELRYRTSPSASALQWLPPELTSGGEYPLMFSQSQAIHARSWVPLQDTPAVRFTYSATIRTPDNLLALMSANNEPGTARDGVYEFDMPQPIPSYLMAIAAGDLDFAPIGEDTGVYAEPELLAASAFEFAGTQDMLDLAEQRYGPYDWGRYDLLILPPAFPYGGMENPRLSFITPSVLAGDRSLVSLIAHELAHSWSGNLVTNATWRDIWLNEGTTSYLEARLMEELYGQARTDEERVLAWNSLQEALLTVPVQFQPLAPRVMPGDGEGPQEGMQYAKGQFFLEHLERQFGRERFDPFLASYFETFAWQSITTEAFLEYLDENLLSRYPGVYTRAQASEWLYEPGVPADFQPPESLTLQASTKAALAFGAGELDLLDLDITQWSPQTTVNFINELAPGLSAEQLAEADGHFGFSTSKNAEISRAWFIQVAKRRYLPAYPAMEAYLAYHGRMRLIVPVYSALASNGQDAALAADLYAERRSRYHPITVKSIDEALGAPENDS